MPCGFFAELEPNMGSEVGYLHNLVLFGSAKGNGVLLLSSCETQQPNPTYFPVTDLKCPDGAEPAREGGEIVRCANSQCPTDYRCTFAEIPYLKVCCPRAKPTPEQCSRFWILGFVLNFLDFLSVFSRDE